MQLSNNYAEHLSSFGHFVKPVPLEGMRIGLFNSALANEIEIPGQLTHPETWLKWLHSPVTPLTRKAFAQKYGGHQFGQWNPNLGDGRGLLLGELKNSRGIPFDLHLKGAGPTPFSRHADGRAVLRSTLREYIAGEALHHLGIPSSRSLCLFTSSELVYRESPEPGAMMIRTAPSHIRFGHFEYYFYSGQHDKLQTLLNYTIQNYFPECNNSSTPYASLLHAIVTRTARLIALWQNHGFVHGVMNTDNMSIHGITFDFGPFAFINQYKPNAVFNHSDHEGRYAFNQQPGIALWNLNALAHAFSAYLDVDTIKAQLATFETTYISQYQHLMLSRMGLSGSQKLLPQALELMQKWLQLLATEQIDYTFAFRQLAHANIQQEDCPFRDKFINTHQLSDWWQNYRALRQSIQKQHKGEASSLLALNPAVVPHTHLLQNAITMAHNDDFSYAEQLLEATCTPYDTKWDNHEFSQPLASTTQVNLSCSS